ncbi:E3 ubiquitin/ISG15 ligase TRIM25-like [Solea senegalensis]|uniref:E3 ubiquitin/ISG15 ligase TRIM25-like n=2 Tax=Solea senegalensis TaxID=28829 RepID=A0AAV6RBC1_SOLSE|nr:E3 ubiquitin/ISG15 ligase TRIM25 [Solea senegalensis]KAG7502003.1 E3 ubiquitin/ISG15 ligase TRIM25-like [Solea senegalensis]
MSGKLWTEEQFNCPVCLDLPNDPVTIPCGHSYCMACIKDYWSQDDPNGVYSCPQCRQTFCPKPNLSRNTMLAEAVEQLRKSGGPRRASSAKPRGKLSSSEVSCDLCKDQQRAAVKSCLTCMSSYCEAHLKPHKTKKSLKPHELIAPTGNLAEKICTQHKYLQEFFCRQCKVFVCWLCTNNLHKGHECVSTKVERLEKQKVVSELQVKNQQRLKDREQELKDMRKMMEGMKRSSERVHDDLEEALSELQRSVQRLQELLEQVLDQAEEEKMVQAQEVTQSLEAEIKELKRRDTEMKDMTRCEDHIHYLQAYETMSGPLESGDLPAVTVNPEASFEPVREAVLDLRDRVEDLCNQELGKISKQVNETTLFTLGDVSRGSGAKAGIIKLFSGLSSRSANSRSPTSSPNVSAGVRSTDRRGLGLRTQDVRSRETPRVRETQHPTPSPTPNRRESSQSQLSRSGQSQTQNQTQSHTQNQNQGPSPTPNRRESSQFLSTRSTQSQSQNQNQGRSPTPSRRESSMSLWSRSSQNQLSPGAAQTSSTPAAPASSGGFSRMASISSLFRSNRRGTNQATPISNPSSSSGAGNPWLDTLSETPTEVNPALFLDSPSPDVMNHAPAFPILREISIDSIQAPEPRARDEFLQYSVMLTLDPNTAHRRLALSEGNTKAALQGAAQPCADTPQRFDGWTQVMCQSPLSAQRCYWEVEWRGRGSSVGVAYGALSRKGNDARSGLGYNARSWTLELSDTCCTAMHDNEKRDIPVTYSPRVGVYLDLSVGTLAFYSVAENMTLLHSFRANFTQPLYAAFGVGSGVGVGLDFALGQFTSCTDSVKICPM